MATDPRKWIYGFISHVPSIISAPARWIADRIFGILQDGVAFAKWIGSGAKVLFDKGKFAIGQLQSFAVEAATTLQWFIGTQVPKLLANLLSSVKAWATTVINTAINAVKATVSTLRTWAEKAVNSVIALANSIRNWAAGQINAILARLRATIDKWYDRLTNPLKMAEWLIAALIGPLWRYVYANRDRIARWFLRTSPAFTMWMARELENVIKRML
jgi:hypothetical protein